MSMLVSVIRAVEGRLARRVIVAEVLVDHYDRAVFRSSDPDLGEVVVKAQTAIVDLAVEVEGMRAAESAGVPVPAVLAHFDTTEFAVLMIPWTAGNPLGPENPDADWHRAGAVLRRLHDHPPPAGLPTLFGGGDESTPVLYRPGPVGALPDPIRHRLAELTARAMAAPQAPGRLLHGDLSPDHLLFHDGRVAAVIDFGLARTGDPVWDLVRLTMWHRGRLSTVLDGYRATRAFRHHVRRLYEPFTVAHHLAACDWLIDHDIDPTPTVRELTRIATEYPPRPTI
ncbi:Ser/Thr protein kinase RdoA (MazF antagonist) [Stackebrandtia albiflava]|uniref:Ser/Thr protein kinase RdoA (MazF antagonist) n=1 Tax=Stackebrandtia albiflava TaxID=406432 RepID=A0A562UQN5_9ACTN|nr:aminoglycoside phosphotransferase family protein [Stackebrandtia albiflava]TWJ07929.1 Ser/Thr protein kinase RdoA (MazF antagonist) [Stackebrandtia albiflava]